MQTAKIYNWAVLSYLSLIAFFTINGNIYWGYGLGDLAYLYASTALMFIQLAIIVMLYFKAKNARAFYICGTVFLLSALFLTREFTIGRGIEYPWNGQVFYKSPF